MVIGQIIALKLHPDKTVSIQSQSALYLIRDTLLGMTFGQTEIIE
jgi:hypothetical protein